MIASLPTQSASAMSRRLHDCTATRCTSATDRLTACTRGTSAAQEAPPAQGSPPALHHADLMDHMPRLLQSCMALAALSDVWRVVYPPRLPCAPVELPLHHLHRLHREAHHEAAAPPPQTATAGRTSAPQARATNHETQAPRAAYSAPPQVRKHAQARIMTQKAKTEKQGVHFGFT